MSEMRIQVDFTNMTFAEVSELMENFRANQIDIEAFETIYRDEYLVTGVRVFTSEALQLATKAAFKTALVPVEDESPDVLDDPFKRAESYLGEYDDEVGYPVTNETEFQFWARSWLYNLTLVSPDHFEDVELLRDSITTMTSDDLLIHMFG
jgi:hypothetical protein